MVDLVEEGFDLAIRPVLPPDSSLIVLRLTPWRHVLCCAPAYLERHGTPERPDDLVRHNCLRYAFYPFGDKWRFTGPAGAPLSVRVSGNLLTNSAETLRAVALSGQGLFLAPSFIVADDLQNGGLVRILEDSPRSSSPSTRSTRTAIISRPRSEASSTCWPSALPNTENGWIRTPPSEQGGFAPPQPARA
jgi:DNA-binding transcriptional LysR family regulator